MSYDSISREQFVAPGFSVAVPGDWIVLDLDAAQDRDGVLKALDRRIEQGVLRETSRQEAFELINRVARDAAESRLRFAAVLITEDADGPVVASLTVMSIWLRTAGDADEMRPAEEAAGRSREPPADTDGDRFPAATRRDASSEEVTLPAGPALRFERTIGHRLSGSLEQEVYSVEYVLPADDRGATLVLSGVSPAVRRKADLDAIFTEIAESIRIEAR
jgi:hypothetical protein